MNSNVILDDKNVIVMKLLHYFITEKNYDPVIVQGVDNEIWLENLDEDYKVVRIVSNYIHNDEQFDFDIFKTRRIMKKIKKKTFSFSINSLSLFLDLGENVSRDFNLYKDIYCVKVNDENDLIKDNHLMKVFPDLSNKLEYHEDGMELFVKITNDINEHNKKDASRMEKLFKSKFPMVTYIIIALCITLYFIPLLFGVYNYVINKFCVYAPYIRGGEYYRLITGIFFHGGVFHLIFNCYALYLIGSQVESFFGKFKFLIIYLFGGICGAIFSMIFGGNTASIGASGAIFGLMGSICYFGYHYRVYLGNIVKSQIIPLILLNLMLGFITPGVDNFAHIGGLIGGTLITVALGVKDKSSTFEKINGWIVTLIFLAFSIYMAFIYAV